MSMKSPLFNTNSECRVSNAECRIQDGSNPLPVRHSTFNIRHSQFSAVRRSKLGLTLAAALAGGSLLGTCQTRLKDAVVGGSTDYLYTLLDPTAIVGLLSDEMEGSSESP